MCLLVFFGSCSSVSIRFMADFRFPTQFQYHTRTPFGVDRPPITYHVQTHADFTCSSLFRPVCVLAHGTPSNFRFSISHRLRPHAVKGSREYTTGAISTRVREEKESENTIGKRHVVRKYVRRRGDVKTQRKLREIAKMRNRFECINHRHSLNMNTKNKR